MDHWGLRSIRRVVHSQSQTARPLAFRTRRTGYPNGIIRALTGRPYESSIGCSTNHLPDLKLVVDGQFGPVTDGRVREFQQRVDIAVDGIVGPQT
ncbi:peptidoglycan-binding domain-containing protein [Streptomyces sp. NPDC003668]